MPSFVATDAASGYGRAAVRQLRENAVAAPISNPFIRFGQVRARAIGRPFQPGRKRTAC
jgi:hypothetical protein